MGLPWVKPPHFQIGPFYSNHVLILPLKTEAEIFWFLKILDPVPSRSLTKTMTF